VPISDQHLRSFADVIVRVGLNLQRGQRLLIAEPYELQGVHPDAAGLVTAVHEAARAAGGDEVEIIWGDERQYRRWAEGGHAEPFERMVATRAAQLAEAVARGDALLFLQSSNPHLLRGVAAEHVNLFKNTAWAHFGPVAQRLTRGATNWTVAPAPTPAWADVVYPELPAAERLPALWATVLDACRATAPDPVAAWQTHLATLRERRDQLEARRLRTLRFRGDGTDLTVALPPEHRWCTACLATAAGRPFVANLPTEEVFTLPYKDSAEGTVRVARPVAYGGAVLGEIRLTFRGGRVVDATARVGADLLQELLLSDAGASRLGEVALVPAETAIARTGRLYSHALLDENACTHVALGEAYPFTLRDGIKMTPRQFANAGGNQSLIHLDLPIIAELVDDDR
jgi:aminopeptidase